MKQAFVRVNGSILDAKEYRRSLVVLKQWVKHRCGESLGADFDFMRGRDSAAGGLELIFYYKQLDVEVKVKVRKKSKWTWV